MYMYQLKTFLQQILPSMQYFSRTCSTNYYSCHCYRLVPRPFEGEEKGPGTYCTCIHQLPQKHLGCHERLYAFSSSSRDLQGMRLHGYDITSYPRCGRRAKKPIVVRDTLYFLGVVGACACNRYQELSPTSQRAWVQGDNSDNYSDIASYPRRGRRAKKPTVDRDTPCFLGVVCACVCNTSFLLPGLGTRLSLLVPAIKLNHDPCHEN